jgi:hypothetical protein
MKQLTEGSVNIARWLRDQVEDSCVRVALRQKTEDTEQHVREWSLVDVANVDDLVEEIEACAHADSLNFRGPTLYGLFSYREGGKRYVSRTLLRVAGQGFSQSMVGETEAADARGLTSQMMRHTEVASRIALGHTQEIILQYQQLLAQRDKRIEDLEARHFKVLELHERLTSMQHERDMEIIRAQQSDKRTDFLKEKLDMLAPVIVSKMIGKGAGGAALGEELMRQFLKSLTPDQMTKIVGSLAPEQAAVINEIYLAYGERELEHETGKKAANAKKTNGQSGTAGH